MNNFTAGALETGAIGDVQYATKSAPIYGAVNGYVGVPQGHPWHGKDYDEIDVTINGGLTFADLDEATGVWWVGFDTLHIGDYWPGMPDFMRDPDAFEWTPTAVVSEAFDLAEQAVKAAIS